MCQGSSVPANPILAVARSVVSSACMLRCALPHPKQESSNIGYIIPTPVVRLFLSEVERRGEFRGISSLGVSSLALALMGHPTLVT